MSYDEQATSEPMRATTVASDRPSHVSGSMAEAEEGMDHLLEAIRELEQRLYDVLRTGDDPEKMMAVPRESLVPLAERLVNHGAALRLARQNVVSILDRLEL